MEILNALQQLAAKKRTYEDLSRFVGERASGTPNYCLLLGAGCSVSSNIRSAADLVNVWRKEIFFRLRPEQSYSEDVARKFLTESQSAWYNPGREYSCLFEKNYDLPRQRRMFVEQEVAEKSPNLGYVYLIRLIEAGYFNTVFTTNFDDLLNEAFFQFSSTRPIVCAHDSSITSVTVTSKRPKIIKLHGDYLFDDIKSTVRETESLEENTRKKFIEFGRDFGLIVVGYGGCDRSVMDVLHYLLRSDDYFKNGVYWCIRRGDAPSDDLVKLLWRDRVYFLEIDGYDELMASLYGDLIGEALPIDTSVITNKPRALISSFCKNRFLSHSSSQIIKRDLERLKRQDEHEQLLSVFRDVKNNSDDEIDDRRKLQDAELAKVIEIKQLINSDDFASARTRIATQLDAKPSKMLTEHLLLLKALVEERAGDLAAAVNAIEQLILGDPNDTYFYVRKSELIPQHEQRMEILRQAESINPYSSRVYNRRLRCLIEAYSAGIGFDRGEVLKDIEKTIEDSAACDPGLGNSVWNRAIAFYGSINLPKQDFKDKLDGIIQRCKQLGENKISFLRARLVRFSKFKEDRKSPDADSLLRDISEWKLKSSKSMQPEFEWLELEAYREFERRDELSKRISELDVNPEYSSAPEYLRRKADFLLSASGDIDSAILAMKAAVAAGKDRDDILRLADMLSNNGQAQEVGDLNVKYASTLKPLDRVAMKILECEAKLDMEGALNQLRGSFARRIVGADERLNEVHDLLLLHRYDEAASVAKSALDALNWNKLDNGPLIVNHELAQLRKGGKVDKARLRDTADVTNEEAVKGCCYFLLNDFEKAREIFKGEIRKDRERMYTYKRWAIFADDRGAQFLEGVIKAVV